MCNFFFFKIIRPRNGGAAHTWMRPLLKIIRYGSLTSQHVWRGKRMSSYDTRFAMCGHVMTSYELAWKHIEWCGILYITKRAHTFHRSNTSRKYLKNNAGCSGHPSCAGISQPSIKLACPQVVLGKFENNIFLGADTNDSEVNQWCEIYRSWKSGSKFRVLV